jgi:hypothetical protein
MPRLTSKLTALIILLAASFFSVNGYAENAREFGPYVIHYNAFRSDTISPEIAKQYGLPRANNRVLVNISVLKKVMGTTGQPTPSKVTGFANNLTGQMKNLDFKEIKEGSAIYYIAETKISDGEFLKFDIKIVPEGETQTAQIDFSKRFFTY